MLRACQKAARTLGPIKRVLAIETSCDDTAVAMVSDDCYVHRVASQHAVHREFKGIVPTLAAEAHARSINALCEEVLKEAGSDFDAIAVTHAPGLPPCLHVGVNKAKSLSKSLDKPIISVHHIHGHVLCGLPSEEKFLSLIVSGGHTSLILADPAKYKFLELGTTLDDAVGEAFDKVARMLKLEGRCHGGALIESLASKASRGIEIEPPMVHDLRKNTMNCDFSFSGLKSSVERRIADGERDEAAVARGFQSAAFEHVANQTLRALSVLNFLKLVKSRTGERAVRSRASRKTGERTTLETKKMLNEFMEDGVVSKLFVSGGVAVNNALIETLKLKLKEAGYGGLEIETPPRELCTDNAVMIGHAALMKQKTGAVEPIANKLAAGPRAFVRRPKSRR